MKFGKLLVEVQSNCDTSWADQWLDYKALKRIIKRLPTLESKSWDSEEAMFHHLRDCPREAEFFTALNHERHKVTEFYASMEAHCARQYRALMERFTAFQQLIHKPEPEGLQLLGEIVKFYTDLLLLENYAVMNYCGFGKILKKHDKSTKYNVKITYMKRMINNQSFSHSKKLLFMIARSELAYQMLTAQLPMTRAIHMESAEKLASLQSMQSFTRGAHAQEVHSQQSGTESSAAAMAASDAPTSIDTSHHRPSFHSTHSADQYPSSQSVSHTMPDAVRVPDDDTEMMDADDAGSMAPADSHGHAHVHHHHHVTGVPSDHSPAHRAYAPQPGSAPAHLRTSKPTALEQSIAELMSQQLPLSYP